LDDTELPSHGIPKHRLVSDYSRAPEIVSGYRPTLFFADKHSY